MVPTPWLSELVVISIIIEMDIDLICICTEWQIIL